MRNFILFTIIALWAASCTQKPNFPTYGEAQNMKTKNMVTIPELEMTEIPGAPVLSQPIHIQGTISEIITEKHGYAYPALFDWNQDGLNDLLIGEFKTGETGSFLQVHFNEGTNEHPVFSGKYAYAKDLAGDTITAYFWCCIGLHPRFVDITGDGIKDMLSGSYNPGIVSMWEGTPEGFKPAVEVEQEGDPRKYINGLPLTDSRSHSYWNYTSVDFADFNGDGLFDMFVSGSGGMRVALNTGTKTKPKFGYRQLLLDVEGNALSFFDKEILDEHNKIYVGPISGDMKSYVNAYDWDKDGIIDLLATSSYSYEGQNPIDFFRGVKTSKGIRFEKRQPLFKAKDGRPRPFPGSATQVKVEDFNNDGIEDLLIGMSILSVQDYQMVDSLAWLSLEHLELPRVGKDLGAGYGDPKRHKKTMEMYKKYPDTKAPWYYSRELDDQILDIYSSRHRGYVYVMYGQEPSTKAEVKEYAEAGDFELPEIYQLKTNSAASHSNGPVSLSIETTQKPNPYDTPMVIKAVFKMKAGWYLYADTKKVRKEGYIPTTIEFETCENVTIEQNLETPEVSSPDAVAHYQGGELVFRQVFKMGRGFYSAKNKKVKVKITYQTCNQDICLPPVTVEEVIDFS